MLLILTGTISPNPATPILYLKDSQERFNQYYSCIEWFIRNSVFDKIIFAENSNYGTNSFLALSQLATDKGKEIEFISFEGDSQAVLNKGKGYGEGEIMHYVIQNSTLLKSEDYFVKITGRLIVENINSIIKTINTRCVYFNIPDRYRRNQIHTRIYAMPLKVFKKYFENEYNRINDNVGIYLESVYSSILLDKKIKSNNFKRYPCIKGISGSSGRIYTTSKIESIVKNLFSILGYYRFKQY